MLLNLFSTSYCKISQSVFTILIFNPSLAFQIKSKYFLIKLNTYLTCLKILARNKRSSLFCRIFMTKKLFHIIDTGADVIKLFAMVIFCHFPLLPSFCIIKPYFHGNCCRMAVNCPGKKFNNICS
jgi:hypothetical protein